MTAASTLQKAIYQTLANHAGLTALTGPGRVHDDVPDGLKPPYLVFAEWTATPLGSSTEDGEEHRVTIDAWSSQNGKAQATKMASAVRAALAGMVAIDPPFALVNCEFLESVTAREPASGLYRSRLVFRAVTENA